MVDSTLIAGTASFAVASPRILLLSSVSHCLRLSSSSSSYLKCRRCPPPSSPLPFVHKLGTFVNDVVEEKLAAAKCFGRKQELSDNMKQKIRAEYEAITVSRRNTMAFILSSYILSDLQSVDSAFAQPSIGFREYIDTFDGYSFKYPQNWIQVRGAGADIFFRDPFVLDENISVEFSSPSSSRYKSVEDLGPPQEAGKKVLKQYLTEFMSTRLGVRRESNILSTSSRIADDGKLYYQVEVNIKSYANNNELAVMPQDRVARLEWDRRYLSVLGVENNRLYELRLQTPESVFLEEENDLRQVMDSFRVNKVSV